MAKDTKPSSVTTSGISFTKSRPNAAFATFQYKGKDENGNTYTITRERGLNGKYEYSGKVNFVDGTRGFLGLNDKGKATLSSRSGVDASLVRNSQRQKYNAEIKRLRQSVGGEFGISKDAYNELAAELKTTYGYDSWRSFSETAALMKKLVKKSPHGKKK